MLQNISIFKLFNSLSSHINSSFFNNHVDTKTLYKLERGRIDKHDKPHTTIYKSIDLSSPIQDPPI